MRSILYRFGSLEDFHAALRGEDAELGLPGDEETSDSTPESTPSGAWVLAVFEIEAGRYDTAVAARLVFSGGAVRLSFEPRDWERLVRLGVDPSPSRDGVPDEPITVDDVTLAPATERAPTFPPEASPPSRRGPSSRAPASKPASKRAPPPSESEPPATKRMSDGPPSRRSGAAATSSSSGASATTSEGPRSRRPSKAMPAAAPSHAPAHAAERTSRSSIAGARLLLVDDDGTLREMMVTMLEAIGFATHAVPSAEDALTILAREPFDLVVLDWILPKMSGIELCKAIRRRADLNQVPILFLTGQSASSDVVAAFAAGADDYVAKPFRAAELGARLFGLLRRARGSLRPTEP